MGITADTKDTRGVRGERADMTFQMFTKVQTK